MTHTERDQLREALRNYPDWLSTLNNIVRALEDEGDRVFLGSTNDADDLREVVKMLDALSHAKALATPDQAVMAERFARIADDYASHFLLGSKAVRGQAERESLAAKTKVAQDIAAAIRAQGEPK